LDTHELQEHTEHAHHSGEKGIGLTTAIVAVLLAVATMLGHRTHSDEITLQTKTNDQWGFYQAKHIRAHEYGALAEIAALLPNGHDVALKDLKISTEEECGVPAEKVCTSPVLKGSPVLQQLVAQSKGSAEHPAEGPAGESNESKPAAMASAAEHPAEKHEKAAGKEGGAKEGKDSAKKVQERAFEMEHEVEIVEQRSNMFDGAELFLEISIVLCSIALLAENRIYWKLSFISTVIGVALTVFGLMLH
jgi:hypothetical protein